MSLGSALNNALSGLRTTQAQIQVISNNVSNVDTPGYSRRQAILKETAIAGEGAGVRLEGVQRALDEILQRELRTETSGSGYTAIRARITDQLQALYGKPGTATALTSVLDTFTQSLQNLATDPASSTARASVISAARSLASGIVRASTGVQDLRTQAEQSIGSAVTRVNELLKGIAGSDRRVAETLGREPALLDQRDAQINELAKLIDVRVQENNDGSVTLTTQAGLRLYGNGQPATFSFDARGTLGAGSLYTNGADRGVGTITVSSGAGTVDAIAQGLIRSGEIAGLVELRDKTLVDAQKQLDELAASLSGALSNRSQAGTAATAGAFAGFDVDLAGLQPGNVVTLTATVGGTARTFSIIRVDAGGTLPANATPDPNDTEIAIPFGGGIAAAAAAIDAALGAGFTVSNPAGNTLRVLNDGAAATTVTGLSASITNTALVGNGPELALFFDGGSPAAPFTGSFQNGSQKTGLAGRLIVNPAVVADQSRLVVYSTSPLTPSGDSTRPALLLERLTQGIQSFAPGAGIGGTTSPFTGTVSAFARRLVDAQAETAASAARLDEGQKIVQASIDARYGEASGVSIDQELSQLVQIQNAYSANARIMSAVRDMLDVLLRI
ncbi:MAG: flagellar hook-associated protein FlgK [Burkholderiales bacterium]|nr:flagellar hook-associated protein FlgK [Burkholderiales bacterium]